MSSFTERLAKMTPVEKERTLASVRRMNEYVFSLEDMNTLVYNNVVKTLRTIFEEDTTEIDPAVIVEAIELDIIDDYDKLFQTEDDFNRKQLFDENTKYFPTILLYLCGAKDECLTKEARTQIALALIKSGKCDVGEFQCPEVDDSTPLTLACRNGYEEIALALVACGKDAFVVDYKYEATDYMTVFATACKYNLPRVAEAIIDYRSDSSYLFEIVLDDMNALLFALENNMWSVVKRLINSATASYDLTHIGGNGMTACDWFREKNMYYDEEIPTLYRTKMFELIEKETGHDDPRYRRIIEAEAEAEAEADPVPVPTKFSCSSSGGEACAPTVIRDGHNQSLTVIAGDTEVEIEKRLTEMIVKLTS